MSIFLCFICLLPIFLVSLLFVNNLKPSKWNLPPGPKKLPIIGNLHNLKGMPHACFRNLSQKYGPVMLLRFGFVNMVVISSKEAAEEALKTHDLECCSRADTFVSRIFSYDSKDIGFSPYGEEWKAKRKFAVTELFTTKKLQSFRYIREEENDLFVKKLSQSALTRSPVNLSKALFTLVAGIVFRIGYGRNLHECKFIDEDSIADLVQKFDLVTETPSFSDFYPGGVGWLIDQISGQNKRLKHVFTELDIFYQNILDDHLKPGREPKNPDIVDVMIDMMKKQDEDGEDSSKLLTKDHLKGIIAEIFLAGVNTGVITLVWAMTELIRNPRVMEKVQEEIRTTLGDKKERLTEEDLTKLHYIKLVVRETLRLHTPVPLLLPRETMSLVKIQGYDIPPKSQMVINVYSIARDPKLWTNQDEFNPDRFIDSSIDHRGMNFELLPFGSGRRMCPGMNMGMANVEMGLLNLLYYFDWALPEGKTVTDIDLEETGALTVCKKAILELVPVLHH